MRLFHVSEEPDIKVFEPRTPIRDDLDKGIKLVWAITENRLMNFLTPRDCPRVTFYVKHDSRPDDIQRFIGSSKVNAVVAIEHDWFDRFIGTSLYLYEFNTSNFVMQDEVAGYYVSTQVEVPISITKVDNLFHALFDLNVEVRLLPNLWELCNTIKSSSLGYSFCRMKLAKPRKDT